MLGTSMKPTRMQVFYAQDWLGTVWFVAFPLLFVLAAIHICEPTISLLTDWRYLIYFIVTILIALLLGFFSSILLGWPILGSLYYDRCLKNGGPFHEGDYFQILAGPHKGRVVQVYSTWQGDTVRVDLGEEEKKSFKDIFSSHELLREKGAEKDKSADLSLGK